MILDCPERLGGVTNTHYDSPILRSVIGPRQLFKFWAATNIDMERMISNRLDGANILEQVFAGVVDPGDKSVFHDRQPVESCPELDAKALETKANAEDREE